MSHEQAPQLPQMPPSPEYAQREAETVRRIQIAEATAQQRMPIQEELVNTDGIAPIDLYGVDSYSDVQERVGVGDNPDRKTFHRPNGQFMSRYELEQLQAPQGSPGAGEVPVQPLPDPRIPRVGGTAVRYSGVPKPSKPRVSFGVKSNAPGRTPPPNGKQTWEQIQAKRQRPADPLEIPKVEDALIPGQRRAMAGREKADKQAQEKGQDRQLEEELNEQLAEILETMKTEGTRGDRIIEILDPRRSYRKSQRASRARNRDADFVYYSSLQRPKPDTAIGRAFHKLIPNRVGYDAMDYADGWVIPNNIINPDQARTQRDEEFSHHNSFVAVPIEGEDGDVTLEFFRRYSWVEEIDGENRGVAVLDKEAVEFCDLPLNLRHQVVRYIQHHQNRP